MRSCKKQICGIVATTLLVLTPAARASKLDELVASLSGNDERARSIARQLLVREDPADVAAKMLPLLASDKPQTWTAAFNVLCDVTAEAGVSGKESQRIAITRELMTLVAPDRPEKIKLLGLRLLPRAVPNGFDVTPMANLLDDEKLREKALAALEEMRTPEASAAISSRLAKAEPMFQCALLNSLSVLKDKGSVSACRLLISSSDAKVRAAAIRSIAWTGDPTLVGFASAAMASADDATRAEALDAYLRLLNAVAEKGGNWEVATGAYVNLLKSEDPLAREGGLAGLGKYGDDHSVVPILEAIKDAPPRTWAIGIHALGSIQGVDAVRAIVLVYPMLPAQTQLALLPILGSKRHALAAAILKEATESKDAAFRVAGLQAVAEAGLPEAADILSKAAASEDKEQAGIARHGLLRVAAALQGENKKVEAGKVYVRAYSVGKDDKEIVRQASEGLANCPVAEGYEVAKAVAADKDAGEPGTKLLLAVAGSLTGAKQNEKALELYELVAKRSPGIDVLKDVARGMAAAGASIDLQKLLGVITRWWVVGPFDLGEQNDGWKTEYIGEPAVSLAAKYMSGKRRVNWTQVVSKDPNGKIDLRATVADTDRAVGYAYTEIDVSQATDAVLLLGVDDSERIWVNGKMVYEQFVARGLQVDQDHVPIKLQAGTNKILLKIWQHTLGWEFCARVSLPDGRPVGFTQAH